MRTLNTTSGPRETPKGTREHVVNTSRVLEEDLTYADEEVGIAFVLDANGYSAAFEDGSRVPLLFWVIDDSGSTHGVVIGEDGCIDLVEGDVEKLDGFAGYEQANNDVEER